MSGVEILSPVRRQEFPEEWYDASEPAHFWFRWRLAVLRRVLSDAGAAMGTRCTALDVGCGSGVLARQLEEATGWTVDGTDLDMNALERCRPRRAGTLQQGVRRVLRGHVTSGTHGAVHGRHPAARACLRDLQPLDLRRLSFAAACAHRWRTLDALRGLF